MFAHSRRKGEQMLHVAVAALKSHSDSGTNLLQTFLSKSVWREILQT